MTDNYNPQLFHASVYAGFWKRFVAYIIDQIIIGFISSIIILPVILFLGIGFFTSDRFERYRYSSSVYMDQLDNLRYEDIIAIISSILILALISSVINWLYYALLESSSKQATIGKMVINLKVTDLNHKRITFGRATGRYFAKILSGLVFGIGYIIAAFTEKKQALHDIIAGCLIVDVYKENTFTNQTNSGVRNE